MSNTFPGPVHSGGRSERYLRIVLIVLAFISAAVSALLIPIRTEFELRIRTCGIFVKAVPRILFGLIPIKIRAYFVYRYPCGLLFCFGKRKPVVLGRKKPKAGHELLKQVKLSGLVITGTVGCENRSDLAVILSGVLGTVINEAVLAALKLRPEVFVSPSDIKNCFSINANGIAAIYPGRLIIEALKLGRRNKNESSNRKHNAFVDGAGKTARRREYRHRRAYNG